MFISWKHCASKFLTTDVPLTTDPGSRPQLTPKLDPEVHFFLSKMPRNELRFLSRLWITSVGLSRKLSVVELVFHSEGRHNYSRMKYAKTVDNAEVQPTNQEEALYIIPQLRASILLGNRMISWLDFQIGPA